MIVIIHQVVGVVIPAETVDAVGELIKETRAVPIIEHDGLSGIAVTRDMVDRAGVFFAQQADELLRLDHLTLRSLFLSLLAAGELLLFASTYVSYSYCNCIYSDTSARCQPVCLFIMWYQCSGF